jgi:outer membrane lipoprotein-sorting protein
MRKRRLILHVLSAAMLIAALEGCAWFRNVTGARPVAAQQCALAADASKEDVVEYFNENTRKITSWKTDKATISTRGKAGIPVRVGATVAVESPRNFRLIAHSVVGNEVDLGSNQEQFWFWNKHNEEKYVFLAHHDEPTKFPLPFQPDWIIEALGVIEIDAEDVTMEPGQPGSNVVYLFANRASSEGHKVRQRTTVDTCRGVIREHALFDARGQLIARAVLSGHFRDKDSQAVLPTRIDLEWPPAQLGMTMTLAEIEVNPRNVPGRVWTVPHYTGYPVRQLTP